MTVEWLYLNTQRSYPFVSPDYAVSAGSFDGNAAFADLGFTPGIHSNFVPVRDSIYLDRYDTDGSTVTFYFKVAYGTTDYEAMACYEWAFTFDLLAPLGSIEYAVAQHVDDGRENPTMGMAFVACGRLDDLTLTAGTVDLTDQPTIEPALIQSDAQAFVNQLQLANEPRPCPQLCCDSSSSSSSGPSAEPSEASSSSSGCVDPEEPEAPLQSAPLRLPLPGGQLAGSVKMRAGFNFQIVVQEASNLVILRAGVNRGEGMQCEDLRTDAEGDLVEDTCLSCGELLYGINGYGYEAEQIQLVGEPGVVVTPYPNEHKVVVSVDDVGLCQVEI